MRRWLTTRTNRSSTNVHPADPPGHPVQRSLVKRTVLRRRGDLGAVGLRLGLVADIARLLVQHLVSQWSSPDLQNTNDRK